MGFRITSGDNIAEKAGQAALIGGDRSKVAWVFGSTSPLSSTRHLSPVSFLKPPLDVVQAQMESLNYRFIALPSKDLQDVRERLANQIPFETRPSLYVYDLPALVEE